jgi:hypothetical protein
VRLGVPYFLIIIPSQMTLENMNFRLKDIIQFVIYIISLTVLFLSLSSKVDNLAIAVDDLKNTRKDDSGETKALNVIIQNDLKTLNIRAELNRQNIEIMKSDIEMLKTQYQNR